MQEYKILAWIGAIVLALSVFMPARLGSVAGQVAYITAQPINGLLLVAVAVTAVLVIYANKSGYMFLAAATALAIVIGIYLRNGVGLNVVSNGLDNFSTQIASLPLVRNGTAAVNFVGGWWMMAAGAVLLVAAALIAPKKH